MEDKVTGGEKVKEPREQNVENGPQSGFLGLRAWAMPGNSLEMQIFGLHSRPQTQKLWEQDPADCFNKLSWMI